MKTQSETAPLKIGELIRQGPFAEYGVFSSINFEDTLDSRHQLNEMLEIYLPYLQSIHLDSIELIKKLESKKQNLVKNLQYTGLLLLGKYCLDEKQGRKQNKTQIALQIASCEILLKALDASNSLDSKLKYDTDTANQPVKFLGLHIGGKIAEIMLAITNGKTVVLRDLMNALNEKRMYWIWGGGLLACVLEVLPDTFLRKNDAEAALAAPNPVMGYMSWILYYARLAVNLFLLLKHAITGPWMSEEEKQVNWSKRFKAQWDQRKFAILNDLIWATANLACFFWLFGRGMAGYWGNVATVGLLLVDTALCIWRFWEESTKHNQTILTLQAQRNAITGKNAEAEEQRKLMQNTIDTHNFNWAMKKRHLATDLTYAVGLVVSFSVVSCAFLPPFMIAPATTMIMGLCGSALCFALTIAYAAVNGALDIEEAKVKKTQNIEFCKNQLTPFEHETNEDAKKLLYLEMLGKLSDNDYQSRLISYQKMQIVRSVVIDAMIPPLVFTCTLFMPMGIGIAFFCAGLVLAALSNIIMKKFEPKADKLPGFDEKKYKEFEKNSSLKTLEEHITQLKPPVKRSDRLHGKSIDKRSSVEMQTFSSSIK